MSGGAAAAARTLHNVRACMSWFQSSTGFNRVLAGCQVVNAQPGKCSVALKVKEEHGNIYGTLHGGLGATLVDCITSLALVGEDESTLKRLGVSVDMSVTYISPAKIGDEILVNAKALKIGKRLAFLECEIRNKDTNQLLLTGKHTKFLG